MVSCHYHQRCSLIMKLISTFILQEPKATAPIVNEANLSLSSPTPSNAKMPLHNNCATLNFHRQSFRGRVQDFVISFHEDQRDIEQVLRLTPVSYTHLTLPTILLV